MINLRIDKFGAFVIFMKDAVVEALKPPFRWRQLLQQLEFIGNGSLNIILLTGFFTGAVFGLQIGGIFKVFNAEGLTGGATGIALATELAPLITGFLLTGRAGSAMTAEISTMVVNEQVDALEAMGVSPYPLFGGSETPRRHDYDPPSFGAFYVHWRDWFFHHFCVALCGRSRGVF